MADTVPITAGSGTSIATDDISSVHYQRIKLIHGADGINAGDVSATNGLPIQGVTMTSTSVNWTSATSLNTASSISVAGMNAVSISVIATSTVTGGAVTFEVSPDNTNWIPLNAARVDSFTTESVYTLVASTNRGWTTSVDGFTNFRVRLSTAITGTATVTVIIIPQTFAIEPIVNTGASSNTATQTNVSASASSVTILAANAARRAASILNLGTSNLFIKIGGGTATTTTANSVLIAANSYFELPQPVYTGAITGIWSATGGSGANITEYT